MKRILNTFKYGSVAVKLTLLATIICGLATAGLFTCAIMFRQLIWFFAMIFAGFITVSLAQTFGIEGGLNDEKKEKKSANDDKENDYVDENVELPLDFYADADFLNNNSDNETNDVVFEEDYEDDLIDKKKSRKRGKLKKNKKDKKEKKAKVKKTKVKKEKKNKDNNNSSEDKVDRIKADSGKKTKTKIKNEKNNNKGDKKKALVSKKALTAKPKKLARHGKIPKVVKVTGAENIDYKSMVKKDIKESKKELAQREEQLENEAIDMEEAEDLYMSEEDKEEMKRVRSKGVVPEPLTADTVKQYTIKKIRKTLHKYKVKRDHKLAIIDRCETFNINQTPAYIWVDGNDFHMLLIEQEPRHLVLSTFKVGRIKYMKKQPVNINTDYEAFNTKSMVTDLFRPYLPDYNQSNVDSDLNYYKNLYGIGPGIYFTNNSAKQLIDFFGFGMDVEDKVTESKRVNLYFKDAYKANIMVRDNVLDANGYADRISSILEEMAASNLSYNEFKETLNLMIKNKFITKEFGMHYMEVRDKKHS